MRKVYKKLVIIYLSLILIINLLAVFETDINVKAELPDLNVYNTEYEVFSRVLLLDNYVLYSPSLYGNITYHNVITKETVDTGIEGRWAYLDYPYIAIYDLNDVKIYNMVLKQQTDIINDVYRIAYPCISKEKLAFTKSEPSLQIDLNQDGDLYDNVVTCYDLITGHELYLGECYLTEIFDELIIWQTGDKIYYYNVTSGTTDMFSYNNIKPWTWKIEDNRIFFELDSPSGIAYYDMESGLTRVISSARRIYDVSGDKVLFYDDGYYLYNVTTDTSAKCNNLEGNYPDMEGNIIVVNDWSGVQFPEDPPPVGMPNVLIYDIQTDQLTNTGIIGWLNDLPYSFDGRTIAISTFEANSDSDLNNDGDKWDNILRYLEPAELEITPELIWKSPTGLNIPINETIIMNFNQPMLSWSVEGAFQLLNLKTNETITGSFEFVENFVYFTPSVNLSQNTTYQITIDNTAQNPYGTAIASSYVWNFTTWIDNDFDGISDSEDTDLDNDGVLNIEDAFPTDKNETTDTDNDGIGNNADPDDDNDGFLDEWEIALGTDSKNVTDTPLDTDSDGKPNGDWNNSLSWMDTDDDNDGVEDSLDFDPLDSNVTEAPSNDVLTNYWGPILVIIVVLIIVSIVGYLFKRKSLPPENQT